MHSSSIVKPVPRQEQDPIFANSAPALSLEWANVCSLCDHTVASTPCLPLLPSPSPVSATPSHVCHLYKTCPFPKAAFEVNLGLFSCNKEQQDSRTDLGMLPKYSNILPQNTAVYGLVQVSLAQAPQHIVYPLWLAMLTILVLIPVASLSSLLPPLSLSLSLTLSLSLSLSLSPSLLCRSA